MPTTLRLAPHVRACRCAGQVILLDLKRSKYLGVDDRHMPPNAISGWPGKAEPVQADTVDADIERLAQPLLRQGILTIGHATTPDVLVPEEARASLNSEDAIVHVVAGPFRTLRMLRSAIDASILLRCCSLLAITRRLAARRVRLETAGTPVTGYALRDPVAAYLKLRPLLLTAHDRCLNDSLSLVNFLAGERIAARWVIGVRTAPFGAHAWVQSGGLVLNDQHEHVRQFQPILSV